MRTIVTFGFISTILLASLLSLNLGMVLNQPSSIIEDPAPYKDVPTETIKIKFDDEKNLTSNQNDSTLLEDLDDDENYTELPEKTLRDTHFNEFQEKVMNGETNMITGVYVDDILALPVIQQPTGQPAFVSPIKGVITQFGPPEAYGVTGLLAHNFLSGEEFFFLDIGQIVTIIFGDGNTQKYEVMEIQEFQALKPNSVNSEFLSLDPPDIQFTAEKLFNEIYSNSGSLVFQTCIDKENNLTWGRLFVIATPLS